jgi:DNA-binding PadR family transcriptional regulator
MNDNIPNLTPYQFLVVCIILDSHEFPDPMSGKRIRETLKERGYIVTPQKLSSITMSMESEGYIKSSFKKNESKDMFYQLTRAGVSELRKSVAFYSNTRITNTPLPEYRGAQEHDEVMRAIGHPNEGDGQEHACVMAAIRGED